jgi:WD40 repeat protein
MISLAFSPDGKYLASGSGWVHHRTSRGDVTVWELATGREAFRLRDFPTGVWSLAWSPDGTQLATGSGNYGTGEDPAVKVWDVSSRQLVFDLKGHTQCVWNVAFSPDGRRLASAAGDRGTVAADNRPGEVRIWDLGTGREVLTLREHAGCVYGVAFSRDGKRLASAGVDGVRVWDFSKEE